MTLRSSGLMIGAGITVVGCAAPARTDDPAAVASSLAVTAAAINGTYNGLMQLASGSPESCGTQDVFSLQVRANSFEYVLQQPQVPWRPAVTFAVSIVPDGSFATVSGTTFIKGQVKQGHMQGQIVGDACGFTFEADNTGSF
jgi:hypothetical protein